MKCFAIAYIFLFFCCTFFSANCQRWKQYADSAVFFSRHFLNEKAADSYNVTVSLLKIDSANTSTLADYMDSLSLKLIDLQKYQEAEINYLDSKEIRERLFGTNSLPYAVSCHNLGYLYCHFLDRLTQGQVLLETAIKIRENVLGTDNLDYALSCNSLAGCLVSQGKPDAALKLYMEVKVVREKLLGANNPECAKVISNIGNIYYSKGDYPKALRFYDQARESIQRSLGKNNQLYIVVTQNLSQTYNQLSQSSKALSLLTDNQQIIERVYGKENPEYYSNLARIGEVDFDLGNFEECEDILLRYRKHLENTVGENTILFAANCWDLGILYNVLGQYKNAEKYLLESKNVRENVSGKNTAGYAACCSNLAETYSMLNQFEKAEALFMEASKVRETIQGRTQDFAIDCYKLGNFYLQTQQYIKAKKTLLEGIEVLDSLAFENSWQYTELCASLGQVHLAMDQYDLAKKWFEKSIHIIVTNDLAGENLALVYKNLSEVYRNKGNIKTSYSFLTKALAIQHSQIKKVFDFTTEVEKEFYLQKVSDFANVYYSLIINNPILGDHGFTYSQALFNRNMIQVSAQHLMQVIHSLTDTSIQEKYRQWNDIKTQLSSWQTSGKIYDTSALKENENKANELEKALTKISKEFRTHKDQSEYSYKKIQRNLKQGEAAIEFLDFNFYDGKRYTDSIFYIALLLRKDKPEPQLIRLFEKKQLDSILKTASTDESQNIAFLYKPYKSQTRFLSKSLYNLIWQPVEKSLNGIKKIYFAPSGDLHTISFAAIPIGNNRVLSDRYQLIELNTTASVSDMALSYLTDGQDIALFGGVKYDTDTTTLKQVVNLYHKDKSDIAFRALPNDVQRGGSFGYLPATEVEVESIKNQSTRSNNPVHILSGVNATEESFKALNGKASPVIIHIATHGFFFPDSRNSQDKNLIKFETSGKVFKHSANPLFRSGLLFAGANYAWKGKSVEGIEDGILTAYEVSNMYLPNTKLVVLSACETALGEIRGSEGVYGLQRAFKIAGVQNLVMSLWKVPDAETSEFMQLLYKNLFAKESISDAFRHSQSVMKNRYRNDPYKWAAWVLVR